MARRPAPGLTRPLWYGDAVALVAAGVALGIALLGPRLLPDTDPVGVDPFDLRLAAVGLALLGAAATPRLRVALPVTAAAAAIVLPFVLWSATPRLLGHLAPDSLDYRPRELIRDGVYVVTTVAIAVAALRSAGITVVAGLRLRLDRVAALAAVGTVVVMVLVFLAIPATLIGRLAVPLAALSRDLPWLGPAFVLQAVAQEFAFRGLLLSTLERNAPPWLANLGQSLLFGLAHIAVQYEGPTDSIVPVTIAVGLGLGWVTQRTGSIWPAVVAHAVLEVGQAYGVLPGLYGQ